MTEPREPLWVICHDCHHSWIGMYLPLPIADAATVMKKLCCPMCAAGSNRIAPTKRGGA